MDVTKFLTSVTNRRRSGMLRQLAKKFLETENGISLSNGMPNTATFPFEEIAVTYKDGTKVRLVGDDLAWSLQYGPSQGYLPLLKKMREFQEYWHKPLQNNWDVLFTSGSMEGCSKVFEMTLEIGDPVLVQVPTYDGILNALRPFMPEFIGVPQDENGLIPENLMQICKERSLNGKKMPKVLYVNPTGANPTGTVLTESRKRQIYDLAQTYNFLIVEDDPYYFLHFLDRAPPSFFELDNCGLVIRLDSFSKILSSGLRLGVVTAHKEFITKLTMHMETTSIHPSSLSQMLLYKLLETWGMQKLEHHLSGIQQFYLDRRNIMLHFIEKHLKGLVEWNIPNAGMFVWVKVNGIENISDLATKKCISEGIFLVPGHACNYDSLKPDQHIRLCYSYATPEQIDKALLVLAKLIREEVAKSKRN